MKKFNISYDALNEALREHIMFKLGEGMTNMSDPNRSEIKMCQVLLEILGSARYEEPDRKKFKKGIFD